MSRSNPAAEAMQAVADAVHELRSDLRALQPREPYERLLDPPRRPAWLGIALRLCVDVETGESLARSLKPVPAEYLTDTEIRCLCGTVLPREQLVECPGCDRWFVADESGAWAARLPEPSVS